MAHSEVFNWRLKKLDEDRDSWECAVEIVAIDHHQLPQSSLAVAVI